VLKAGGAYVPLDPSYPGERLDFMLRDSRAHLLLTQERLRRDLPAQDVQVVCLDAESGPLDGEPPEPPESGLGADNLAYVIYTSGSTGTPKGVGITHGNAVAFLTWAHHTTSAAAGARVLATTSISFDLSVYEIFGTLSWGGTVLLIGSALELSERPDLRAPGAATLLNTVPSAAAALVRMGAVPAGLVRVNLAGEPVSRGLVEALYATGAGEVHNLYGPSETTTYSTAAHLVVGQSGVPGIGRPIANTRAYVLDRDLEPVPIGVPGELYLAGAGVARGYLGRPALTAERFVPDPFADVPGARLYRTGDRARYRADGTLEFLGRLDHQVKIRGFRVEPGEVAATLAEHPGVGDVIVVAREDGRGDRRLVAYLVPAAGASVPEIDELRGFLQARLPEHMIPSAFVLLEAMPLTPSGKVDRGALPAPEHAQLGPAELVSPRTPVEEAIAEIWIALLRLDRVGVHDNFFALGGHSLLAAQLVARLRAAFGLELPLSALFETPTVAGLAGRIEETIRLLEEVASLTADQARLELSRETR
jgi:amino acid adenylation domain-containing protein